MIVSSQILLDIVSLRLLASAPTSFIINPHASTLQPFTQYHPITNPSHDQLLQYNGTSINGPNVEIQIPP